MQDEQFRALLDRDDVKTVAFHEYAAEEISKMFIACGHVGLDHGKDSAEYLDMVESLHNCLPSLFRKGFGNHAYVTRDADLSLYIQDGPSFVMGMIFHRNRKWDNPPEGHQQPGTWSLHS